MGARVYLTLAVAAALSMSSASAAGPRARLIEARNLAYDANYRNDQAGLRSAIAALQPLTKAADERADTHYYLSWTYWALCASQMQAKEMSGALESAKLAVEHARSGLALRNKNPELHTALVNGLISVGIVDGSQFKSVLAELMEVRAKALELGPSITSSS